MVYKLLDKDGKIKPESLILVHATDYLPKKDRLYPTGRFDLEVSIPDIDGNSTKIYRVAREVISFSLNDIASNLVPESELFDKEMIYWEKKNFAIIIPYVKQVKDSLNQNSSHYLSKNIISIHPHDTSVLGSLWLSEYCDKGRETLILCREGENKESIELTNDRYVIVETFKKDELLRDVVRRKINEIGFPVIESGGYKENDPWFEKVKGKKINRNEKSAFSEVPNNYGMYHNTPWFSLDLSSGQLAHFNHMHRARWGWGNYRPFDQNLLRRFIAYHEKSIFEEGRKLFDDPTQTSLEDFIDSYKNAMKICIENLSNSKKNELSNSLFANSKNERNVFSVREKLLDTRDDYRKDILENTKLNEKTEIIMAEQLY